LARQSSPRPVLRAQAPSVGDWRPSSVSPPQPRRATRQIRTTVPGVAQRGPGSYCVVAGRDAGSPLLTLAACGLLRLSAATSDTTRQAGKGEQCPPVLRLRKKRPFHRVYGDYVRTHNALVPGSRLGTYLFPVIGRPRRGIKHAHIQRRRCSPGLLGRTIRSCCGIRPLRFQPHGRLLEKIPGQCPGLGDHPRPIS